MAIAKDLADTGATIIVGTWPPVLKIFEKSLAKGAFDANSTLSDGSKMVIGKEYPLFTLSLIRLRRFKRTIDTLDLSVSLSSKLSKLSKLTTERSIFFSTPLPMMQKSQSLSSKPVRREVLLWFKLSRKVSDKTLFREFPKCSYLRLVQRTIRR